MQHQVPRNGTHFQDDKMSSLALREQLLLGSILAAALAGVGIKHWRDARREVPAAIAAPISGPVAHPVDIARPDTP